MTKLSAGLLTVFAITVVLATPVSVAQGQDESSVPDFGSSTDGNEIEDTTIDDDIFIEGDDESVSAGVTVPGNGPAPSEPADEAPRCVRREATIGSIITSVAGGEVDPSLDPFAQGTMVAGTVTLLAFWERCDGGQWRLVYVEPVDPLDLVPDAERVVREGIDVPMPNINPDPSSGGFVNLGLWFAVEEPSRNPVVARAELSGVWAEARAVLVGIEVDPGSGDPPIVCEGLGVPIESVDPSLETVEQGPCGYTYTQSSPEDAPFQMTVTNVYDLTWRTSDGRSGDLGAARPSVTFDYDVDEIQTVGGP